ncbi:MAG: S41 family peptidase [Polyangiaceae bacterium]
MSLAKTAGKASALLIGFGIAAGLAFRLGGGGLWEGLTPAIAANNAVTSSQSKAQYDLTALRVVNEVLKLVRDRYVDPKRVKPKEMLLSALNNVQRDVAQVIVIHEDGAPTAKVRVDTQEKEFRVDNVQGPWDVSARLRDVFAFLQDVLRGTEVDLRDGGLQRHAPDARSHSVLLSPEAYKEMSLSTSGQFGGLGIVISIRDQQLTVINPMPNTPAGRAGLKKYDRITKINGESTLNMGLTEAVNLRGVLGTKVTVFVHRDGPGWLDRLAAVRSRSRDHPRGQRGEAGSPRRRRGLRHFEAVPGQHRERSRSRAHRDEEAGGRRAPWPRHGPSRQSGRPVDQRPKVADKFLSEGPIVATVGSSEGREERKAQADGTEPNYPIALLINGSSASASEIVAGAMKNHDRAVLIGETSFGKGSVQLLFPELPDKAALKLTIAQYLTEPGDVSIQGVGVTPDVELDPMTVDDKEMDLTVDSGSLRERDLSRSLSNARAREGQRPSEIVRYYLAEKDRWASSA